MIRKSGHRLSLATNAECVCAEIMLNKTIERDDDSKKSHPALVPGGHPLAESQSEFRLGGFDEEPSDFSRRESFNASASSQSRKVTIFGRLAVAFGQTIQ